MLHFPWSFFVLVQNRPVPKYTQLYILYIHKIATAWNSILAAQYGKTEYEIYAVCFKF